MTLGDQLANQTKNLKLGTAHTHLFHRLAPHRNLRRLVLFENSHEPCSPYCFELCECRVRDQFLDINRAVARASLNLEQLSASFMVDASRFFQARELSWRWPNLTSLALTSQLLDPTKSRTEIADMLEEAAAAAMYMPRISTIEIWNGRRGTAALFRYTAGLRRAAVTWRATWRFALPPRVVRAWEAVALRRRGAGSVDVTTEFLGGGDGDGGAAPVVIRSHGDAVHCLELLSPVMRPVSLRQIRMVH